MTSNRYVYLSSPIYGPYVVFAKIIDHM